MQFIAKVIAGRRRFFAGSDEDDEEWFPDRAHGTCCAECGINSGMGFSEEFSDLWVCETCSEVEES